MEGCVSNSKQGSVQLESPFKRPHCNFESEHLNAFCKLNTEPGPSQSFQSSFNMEPGTSATFEQSTIQRQNDTDVDEPPAAKKAKINGRQNNIKPNNTSQTCSKKRIESLSNIEKTNNNELFNCDECDLCFRNTTRLKEHKLKMHSSKRYFQCDLCSAFVETKPAFLSHIKIHTLSVDSDNCPREFRKACNTCTFKTRDPYLLILHKNVHSIQTLNCKLCQVKFLSQESFNLHMRKVHKVVQKAKKTWTCQRCNESFNASLDFGLHLLNSHHTVKSQPTLTENRSNNSIPQNHKDNVQNLSSEQLQCDECLYKTTSKYLLSKHGETHIKCKTASCVYCDITCKNGDVLKKHLESVHKVFSVKKK